PTIVNLFFMLDRVFSIVRFSLHGLSIGSRSSITLFVVRRHEDWTLTQRRCPTSLQREFVPVARQEKIFEMPRVGLGISFAAARVALRPGGHPVVVMTQLVNENVDQLKCARRIFCELQFPIVGLPNARHLEFFENRLMLEIPVVAGIAKKDVA